MGFLTDSLPENRKLIAACIGLCIIYLLGSAVYNVFFHPLSRIPGPFLCKISSIPSFYHACRGSRHIWLWQNFQIYGHKFRVYPNGVVYNDAKTYAQIYNIKANVRRADFYAAWQRNKHDVNTMLTTDNALHAKRRRLLTFVFTDKAVRAAGIFVYKHIDRWHELLLPPNTKDWSSPVDIARQLDYVVFDIMGDLCFGRSFETKEPPENALKAVPHAICEYVQFMYPIARSPLLQSLVWIKPRGLDYVFELLSPSVVRNYFKFLHQSVTDRIRAEEEHEKLSVLNPESNDHMRQDMFHFLIQARDPETGQKAYSEEDLRSEANLLIVAGSESTAVTLSGFFFYLTQDTHVYDKLVHEIRTTFQSVDEIVSGPKLFGCQYLKACIDESMRLAPAGGSELSRTVLEGGMEVDGDYLPEGITVGHSDWCTGRNEHQYRDFNVYRPERWIADEATGVTAEDVANARGCLTAFSAGPGSCMGKGLALLEIMSLVARTLYRMDVRRAPATNLGEGKHELGWGRRDGRQYQFQDSYVAIRHGPMLQFKRRHV